MLILILEFLHGAYCRGEVLDPAKSTKVAQGELQNLKCKLDDLNIFLLRSHDEESGLTKSPPTPPPTF